MGNIVKTLEPTCKLRWLDGKEIFVVIRGEGSVRKEKVLQQWHQDNQGGGEWIDIPTEQ